MKKTKTKNSVKIKSIILFASLSLFCVSLLMCFLLPLMTNLNSYKSSIESELSKKFNTSVVIESDINYSIFPCTEVYVENIKIKDFDIDRLIISISLSDLLTGNIGLKNMQIESSGEASIDVQKYISLIKEFNDFSLSQKKLKINGQDYSDFQVEITTKDDIKIFLIVFKNQEKKYQISGEILNDFENQIQVYIYENDDNVFESNGFFKEGPFVYYANYKAKTDKISKILNNLVDSGTYNLSGQIRYQDGDIILNNSTISGNQIKGSFSANFIKDKNSIDLNLSELTVSNDINVMDMLINYQDMGIKLFVANLRIQELFGELNFTRNKDNLIINFTNDTSSMSATLKFAGYEYKGNTDYKDTQFSFSSKIEINGNNLTFKDDVLEPQIKDLIKSSTIFKNMQLDFNSKNKSGEDVKRDLKKDKNINPKGSTFPNQVSQILPSSFPYTTQQKGDDVEIKSKGLNIALKKTQSDTYEINYDCNDAKKCLDFKYLRDDIKLSFIGTMRFFDDGYEISQIKGTLNSYPFSGVVNNNNFAINFDSLNYDLFDKNMLNMDIYLQQPNFITNIFNETKNINIKIKSFAFNGKNLPNIDFSYKDYALKIMSPNFDIFARLDADLSGYIKMTSVPLQARIFTNSPAEMFLNVCDVDAIFVSKNTADFSSLFFDMQSDFKVNCTQSQLTGFNLKDAIKGVYALSSLSLNNVSNALSSNLQKTTSDTSKIFIQGQLSNGKADILKFTSINEYGIVNLVGSIEFLTKKFMEKGDISINHLSLKPIKLDYKNQGSLYKNEPLYNYNNIFGIQKSYLDFNRKKLKFLKN